MPDALHQLLKVIKENNGINDLIVTPESSIDEGESVKFLKRVTAL